MTCHATMFQHQHQGRMISTILLTLKIGNNIKYIKIETKSNDSVKYLA